MPTDTERALWGLEESLDDVLSFVKGAAYGLRLATKRVGDLRSRARAVQSAKPQSAAEMERLVEALQNGEDRLSDLAVLAIGDHFRAFLARVLEREEPPPLPATPAGVEELVGAPGALRHVPFWFALTLQLYRSVLRGGRLDQSAFEALGLTDLEIAYPGGKVKLFREGDHVTLTETQIEEAAAATVEAARTIRLRLLTA
ncbi:MAG: hypothetical protein Kow0092_07250 [Deferrisomatales bacterium]